MSEKYEQEQNLDSFSFQGPLGHAACKYCMLYNYQTFARHGISPNLSKEPSTRAQFFALGMNSEAGEVAGDIMKHYVYAPEQTSKEQILKEIGDNLWYIANILTHFDSSFSEVMMMNVNKLTDRYPSRYTNTCQMDSEDQASKERFEQLITIRDLAATTNEEKASVNKQIDNIIRINHSQHPGPSTVA